jgi:hypothetical protein
MNQVWNARVAEPYTYGLTIKPSRIVVVWFNVKPFFLKVTTKIAPPPIPDWDL